MTTNVRLMTGWLAAVLVLGTLSASASSTVQQVTGADLETLERTLKTVSDDVSRVRDRDAALAARLEREVDEAREDLTYLRVKLRRQETVSRSEFADLSDRLTSLRRRAQESGRSARSNPNEVPVGTEMDVRLLTQLSSATAKVEDRFEATSLVDLFEGDRVLVPAGSVLRGVVSSVDPATRTDRKGSLTLSFDRITVNRRDYPIRATVTDAIESEGIRGEAARIGTGAGVGAILGGILGGFKGALAGILIGGGGVVAATEGKDVQLPAGTVLRVRFDQPVSLESRDDR